MTDNHSPLLSEDGDDGSGALSPEALSRCSSAEARALLPFDLACRLEVLPLGFIGSSHAGVVTCAVGDHAPPERAIELRFALGREVRLISVPQPVLTTALRTAYQGDPRRLDHELTLLQATDLGISSSARRAEPESLRLGHGEAANFLATLLEYAIARGASDLHIAPRREGTFIRLRIGGELQFRADPVCSLALHAQLIGRLKVLARLDTTVRNQPLDGAFVVPRVGGAGVSARLSIMPTIHGDKAVVRFLGHGGIRPLGTLGYSPVVSGAIERFVRRREGAALFAGPTGSGKSTAIYAALAACVERGRSVVSIEDPVEVEIPGVSQTSLNPEHGLDYAAALRAVLRQDPDVIALGEIRDEESAAAALRAALTGHLVISTVHARSAREVALRLRDLGVDDLTHAQAIRLVVCQRLVPVLCARCKVIDLMSSAAHGLTVYRPVGCVRCDYSGFSERVLVAEVLEGSGEFPEERCEVEIRDELKRLLGAGRITLEQFAAFGSDY